MKILEKTEVFTNDRLVSLKNKVSFFDRLSTVTLEGRLILQGSGQNNFRAVVIAERFFWMSNETFADINEALMSAKKIARNHLPEINFALRIPAKTAERMKFVWVADKD